MTIEILTAGAWRSFMDGQMGRRTLSVFITQYLLFSKKKIKKIKTQYLLVHAPMHGCCRKDYDIFWFFV